MRILALDSRKLKFNKGVSKTSNQALPVSSSSTAEIIQNFLPLNVQDTSLTTQTQEKDKPWWKQPFIWILGALTLLTGAVGLFVRVRSRRGELETNGSEASNSSGEISQKEIDKKWLERFHNKPLDKVVEDLITIMYRSDRLLIKEICRLERFFDKNELENWSNNNLYRSINDEIDLNRQIWIIEWKETKGGIKAMVKEEVSLGELKNRLKLGKEKLEDFLRTKFDLQVLRIIKNSYSDEESKTLKDIFQQAFLQQKLSQADLIQLNDIQMNLVGLLGNDTYYEITQYAESLKGEEFFSGTP